MGNRSNKPTSAAKWEKEVPDLTVEQLKNQEDILKGLGKSVYTEEQLRKSRWLYHTPDAYIDDYRILIPTRDDEDV